MDMDVDPTAYSIGVLEDAVEAGDAIFAPSWTG